MRPGLAVCLSLLAGVPTLVAGSRPGGATRARPPLAFEPLPASDRAGSRFVAHGRDHTLLLSPTEVVVLLSGAGPDPTAGVMRMRFVGADPAARLSGLQPEPGTSSYFRGRDPAGWRTGVPRYGRLRCEGVYPGVDVTFHQTEAGQLELDFTLARGARPEAIRLAFDGNDSLDLAPQGEVILTAAGRELRLGVPLAYEDSAGARRAVRARWRWTAERALVFTLEGHEPRETTVIDPVLSVATYLGGSDPDQLWAVAVDAAGNIYLAGGTQSADFPTEGPLQDIYAGAQDAVVAKLSPDGSNLLYATYFGGARTEDALDVGVDRLGNAYITGVTTSADLPVRNALQPVWGGAEDVFIAALNPSGSSLLYATYLGGRDRDAAFGIHVAPSGAAYLIGDTSSSDFPTSSPIQAANAGLGDAFVAGLSAGGTTLLFSTFLGGSDQDEGLGITLDPAGNIYLVGQTWSSDFPCRNPFQAGYRGSTDLFVTQLDPSGTSLVYSTYLGGADREFAAGIAVDAAGAAHVCGTTASVDFPILRPFQAALNGPRDVCLTKLTPSGSAVEFSTYLGGSDTDSGSGIVLDAAGNIYLVGSTSSVDFPTVVALQPTFAGGWSDAFLAKVDASGNTLLCATYLGGSDQDEGLDLALDGLGAVDIAGRTRSIDFPVVAAVQPALAGEPDAFFARLDIACSAPPATIGNTLRVVRSPGELVFTWTDVPEAVLYTLFQDPDKDGLFATRTATASAGLPGISVPIPAAPRLMFRLSGANCCGEGLK